MTRAAAQLTALVDALGVGYGRERSFRLSPGQLLADRFLLSVGTDELGGDGGSRLLALYDELSMPAPLAEIARRHVTHAGFAHFGVEQDGRRTLYKAYLEVGRPDTARAGERVLLHLAFKWEAGASQGGVTRYELLAGLSAAQIRERLATLEGGPLDPGIDRLIDEVLRRTEVAPGYLEVAELDNPRRSFDLNVYDAGLRLADVREPLLAVGGRFDVAGPLEILLDGIGDVELGHLASGVHRSGQPFLTVYYGVESVPR